MIEVTTMKMMTMKVTKMMMISHGDACYSDDKIVHITSKYCIDL